MRLVVVVVIIVVVVVVVIVEFSLSSSTFIRIPTLFYAPPPLTPPLSRQREREKQPQGRTHVAWHAIQKMCRHPGPEGEGV